MTQRIVMAAALALGVAVQARAAELTFDGITFPEGAVSFADEAFNYEPNYGGGNVPTSNLDPDATIGTPDDGALSLGSGGRVTLKFLDNALTGSGDSSADLHIFEVGPLVEDTFVEISRFGEVFFDIGKVTGGTSSIDIDEYDFDQDDQFFFVRLRDDPEENQSSGEFVGADIDAVGAITTERATPPSVIPTPAAGAMGLMLLGGLLTRRPRRRSA